MSDPGLYSTLNPQVALSAAPADGMMRVGDTVLLQSAYHGGNAAVSLGQTLTAADAIDPDTMYLASGCSPETPPCARGASALRTKECASGGWLSKCTHGGWRGKEPSAAAPAAPPHAARGAWSWPSGPALSEESVTTCGCVAGVGGGGESGGVGGGGESGGVGGVCGVCRSCASSERVSPSADS